MLPAARPLHQMIRRIVIALIAMVAICHAIAPFGTPLSREPGSAFSAATTDVSLCASCPANTMQIAAKALGPGIHHLLDSGATSSPPLTGTAEAPPIVEATGPPPDRLAAGPFAARAPPLA